MASRRERPIGRRGADLEINGYVVAQFPNPPLILALFGLVASWLLGDGSTAHAVARAIFYVGLTIWAYLELAEGVNAFRRVLGAAALAWLVFSLQSQLT